MSTEHDPEEMNETDRSIEAGLSRLSPAPTRLSASETLLQSRLRLADRRIRIYRAVAAVLAVALGISLTAAHWPAQHPPQPVAHVPPPPRPAPPTQADNSPPPAPPAMAEEYRVCQAIADHGLAALPSAPPEAEIRGHADGGPFDAILLPN